MSDRKILTTKGTVTVPRGVMRSAHEIYRWMRENQCTSLHGLHITWPEHTPHKEVDEYLKEWKTTPLMAKSFLVGPCGCGSDTHGVIRLEAADGNTFAVAVLDVEHFIALSHAISKALDSFRKH